MRLAQHQSVHGRIERGKIRVDTTHCFPFNRSTVELKGVRKTVLVVEATRPMSVKRISLNVDLHGNPVLGEKSYVIIPPQTERHSAKHPHIAEKALVGPVGLDCSLQWSFFLIISF